MTLEEPGELGYNDFSVSLFYLGAIDSDHIQDANVTIALKGIVKKNAVTKEKRLTEFLKMLENSDFDIKDYHILVCWLQSYPRLAIDSQKSVRHLSHQILSTYMEKFGVKEFSKYLKTAVPILLQGLFDDKSIASSVKLNLLQCFAGDETKVNSKVWIIFHEQIINYCHAILVHESPRSITDERSETLDEVNLKYERAANSAILMLLQIIRLSNKEAYFANENSMLQFNNILTSEQFWERFGICSSKDSVNAALFRSFLALIGEIFALDENGNLMPFTSHLEDVKFFYKMVSKKFLKNLKVKPPSGNSSFVTYSTVVVSLINVLTVLTDFKNDSIIKIKKSFWQYGGSKSFSRLKDVLKIGPSNSDPIYYKSLNTLFVSLSVSGIGSEKDFDFIDFSSARDAKNIVLKILLPHFENLKGINALSFKQRGIQCITQIFKLFADRVEKPQELETTARTMFVVFLNSISNSRVKSSDAQIRNFCIADMASFFSWCFVSDHNCFGIELLEGLGKKNPTIAGVSAGDDYTQFCVSYFDILTKVSHDYGNEFLRAIIEKVEESYDVSQLQSALAILLQAISSDRSAAFVAEWASANLPAFISRDFIKLPLTFLKTLLKTNFELDYGQLINDFYLKVSAECTEYVIPLFEILSESATSRRALFEESTPNADAYLISLSQNGKRSSSENNLILAYSERPEIIANLIESTERPEWQRKLLPKILKHGSLSNLRTLRPSSIDALAVFALDTIKSKDSEDFLKFAGHGISLNDYIYSFVLSSDLGHDFEALALFLARNQQFIPLEKLKLEVNKALKEIDLSKISVSNPLMQIANLIERSESPKLSPSVIKIAAFMRDLSRVIDSDNAIRILASVCAEYINDLAFLASSNESDGLEYLIGTLGDMGVTTDYLDGNSITEALNGASKTDVISDLLRKISGKDVFSPEQFYFARVIVRALSPHFETMSLSDFDSLEISYTNLGNHPLKLAVLICAASKFVGVSSKLDRIRNYVFAEVLGVRTTDICSSGITWLSLANSFIDVSVEYDILPGHKMGMLVNRLADWLESDIAYEGHFTTIRALIASFLLNLIRTSKSDVPDKTWGLAIDLCSNNFGIAQLSTGLVALEFFTLKLFIFLRRRLRMNKPEDWERSQKSIEEEILDLAMSKQAEDKGLISSDQPTVLICDLFERALSKAKFSRETLEKNADKLIYMLASSTIVGTQKLACLLLKQYIYENQQDIILETQMRLSNVSSENNQVGELIKLSPIMVQTISDRDLDWEDAVEKGSLHDIFRYLWTWVLLFDHFKESTYHMKAAYISQLKDDDSVKMLLDRIFDTLPLTDQGFLNTLVLEPVEKTEKATPAQCLLQNYDIGKCLSGGSVQQDINFTLAHLCYSVFQYLGSCASQWFNEIRDVQLRQQVERFAIRFVSPVLISEMLEDVGKAKDKLTNNDDTLTMKVNKVTNEVKSTYLIDEQNMIMVVKIPENFPLSSVSVEGPLRLGVKENQWKAWLLASQRVITLTNGSIFDSIELFNKNVNLHFSGFEECAICYSILHQDHSLPSKNCPTCSNKFHAACLYKWFKSSGSSTCPLCRSAFNFNIGRS